MENDILGKGFFNKTKPALPGQTGAGLLLIILFLINIPISFILSAMGGMGDSGLEYGGLIGLLIPWVLFGIPLFFYIKKKYSASNIISSLYFALILILVTSIFGPYIF